MNIFIYSDESGVFDKLHNEYFVFGGVIFLSKNAKDRRGRMYISAEYAVRQSEKCAPTQELKACKISNSSKGKLYRSLNGVHKFAIIINQQKLLDRIFEDKKSKQRYLDWAYKIGVKRFFQHLIKMGEINPDDVERLFFCVDEHSTATNGLYELRESLEQEFKYGTIRYDCNMYYPPIFPRMKEVCLDFCDSSSTILIRAADIVANRVYYLTTSSSNISQQDNLYTVNLP